MNIERAVGFNRQPCDFITLRLDELAIFDIRGVLDGGRDDMPFPRMGQERAMDGRVITFSTATGENDLPRVSSDQGGNFFTSEIDRFDKVMSKRVRAGRIPPFFGEIRKHRLDHLGSDPGGGVVIKIMDLALAHSWRSALVRAGRLFRHRRNCKAMLQKNWSS